MDTLETRRMEMLEEFKKTPTERFRFSSISIFPRRHEEIVTFVLGIVDFFLCCGVGGPEESLKLLI
ncbi:hypothetical protein EYF80_012501 [Liparis tanakae]|uniref:Uncharacterized protein n=1 Tax=Liparis tanakae TaxID=230148 RepID=A0A4Z2IGW5_9TELE|nr:hypothetical protein EYF80_012501 [Liparis tanakae]